MRGPTANLGLDGVVIAEYLGSKTKIKRGGEPLRERTFINGVQVAPDDKRAIRRWAGGKTATRGAFDRLLERHGLTLNSYIRWAKKNGITPTLRGEL